MTTEATTYHYATAQPSHMHAVFVPPILASLRELQPKRVLDLGCGNGSLSGLIRNAGHSVEGCDPSVEGIQQAGQTAQAVDDHGD